MKGKGQRHYLLCFCGLEAGTRNSNLKGLASVSVICVISRPNVGVPVGRRGSVLSFDQLNK